MVAAQSSRLVLVVRVSPCLSLWGKAVLTRASQTGAASGIGEAAAKAFAHADYHVILADRSVKPGEALAAELRAAGHAADFVQLDIADEASVQACVDFAASKGRIDCAVNCAGASRSRSLLRHTVLLTPSTRQASVDLLRRRIRFPRRRGSKCASPTGPRLRPRRRHGPGIV